jgi:hypothetical protein
MESQMHGAIARKNVVAVAHISNKFFAFYGTFMETERSSV